MQTVEENGVFVTKTAYGRGYLKRLATNKFSYSTHRAAYKACHLLYGKPPKKNLHNPENVKRVMNWIIKVRDSNDLEQFLRKRAGDPCQLDKAARLERAIATGRPIDRVVCQGS